MVATVVLTIVGRVMLGGMFAVSGARNFRHVPLHTGIFERMGIPLARLVLVAGLLVELGGGLMVTLGFYPAIGAIGLVVFTLAATAVYHNPLRATGDERVAQITNVLTNASLIGALLLVIALG